MRCHPDGWASDAESRSARMHTGSQQMNRGIQAVDRLLELAGLSQRVQVLVENMLQVGQVFFLAHDPQEVIAMQ